MTCYSVQPKSRTFLKVYGFLSFVKNMGRKRAINIGKDLSSEFVRNFLMMLKMLQEKVIKKQQKPLVV